jgi:hypothetical protein
MYHAPGKLPAKPFGSLYICVSPDAGTRVDFERRRWCNLTVQTFRAACSCPAGGVVVTSHTLDLLQQHQQTLQQCAALFSHIQTFLQGTDPPPICTLASSWHAYRQGVLGVFGSLHL